MINDRQPRAVMIKALFLIIIHFSFCIAVYLIHSEPCSEQIYDNSVLSLLVMHHIAQSLQPESH